jgi:hypothetical protein
VSAARKHPWLIELWQAVVRKTSSNKNMGNRSYGFHVKSCVYVKFEGNFVPRVALEQKSPVCTLYVAVQVAGRSRGDRGLAKAQPAVIKAMKKANVCMLILSDC